MSGPSEGHYAKTKEGRVWVGSTNGRVAMLEDRIRRARAAFEAADTLCDYFALSSAVQEALNILEEA